MKKFLPEKSVVLVDKPEGMTSFDVVERAGSVFGIQKAGHTGTLDPKVTGLMIIALGESRKAMPVLVGMDKVYEGIMILHRDTEKKRLEASFRKFTGDIKQKPPVRSRVARRERKRKIYSLDLRGVNGREVLFKVKCEAGTYIRKLIHDIGQDLGCGAHMGRLRRTAIGPFRLREAVPLSDLSKKDLIPLEKILDRIKLKRVEIKRDAVGKVRNGSPVLKEWIRSRGKQEQDEIVGIFGVRDRIIALGRVSGENIKTERVFLE